MTAVSRRHLRHPQGAWRPGSPLEDVLFDYKDMEPSVLDVKIALDGKPRQEFPNAEAQKTRSTSASSPCPPPASGAR
jgi:hypothetical protein